MLIPSCPRVTCQLTCFQVDELWESLCTASMSLTSKALNDVTNAEVLLKVKGFIALFVQTMEVCYMPFLSMSCQLCIDLRLQGWGYNISTLDSFLLTLFEKYAELLKFRFSEDFQEVRRFCHWYCIRASLNIERLCPRMTICPWPSTPPRNMRKL